MPTRQSVEMLRTQYGVALLLVALLADVGANAQTLPAPSRTVFRCDANGKATYSDVPCLGAERLEVEPSRGVGNRAGADVQQERHREQFAEAVRPLTKMSPKQLDIYARRLRLSNGARRECEALDREVLEAESMEKQTAADRLKGIQAKIYSLRERQIRLQC